MGFLPSPRATANVRPFTECGVDYFGQNRVKIGERQEKRYGVLLFTCLTVRAIRFEMTYFLETDNNGY